MKYIITIIVSICARNWTGYDVKYLKRQILSNIEVSLSPEIVSI
jgi:hypothetical protein